MIKKLALLIPAFLLVLTLSSSKFLAPELEADNLTSVSDTLSNARLSYFAWQDSASAGTNINIKSSGSPSNNTNNLFAGETVLIGNDATATTYTISDITDTTNFQITTTVSADDDDSGDAVIATRSGKHTFTFTPVSVLDSGDVRVLIRRTATASKENDGLPDQDGFDRGDSFALTDIDCSSLPSGTAVGFGNVTVNGLTYHYFECDYTGNNALSSYSIGIGQTAGTHGIINPSPASSHTAGTADTYNIIVQHRNSSAATIDSTAGKIAVVESVRVTASVDPYLSFAISLVTASAVNCGASAPADVSSTAVSVPFGSLSLASFNDAQQGLSITTNADGGYTLKARQYDQLGLRGATCTGKGPTFSNACVPDSIGDDGTADYNATDLWTSTTVKGWGYSLQADIDGGSTSYSAPASIAFEWDDATGNCTGGGTSAFCAKQFADYDRNSAPEDFQTLFSSTDTADAESAFICYRLLPSTTQESGNYETAIDFLATATF